MKVLAISGYKGSGKDTVADYLVKEKGYTRVAFADVLKEMVSEQYGISLDHMHNQDLKEKPILSLPVDPKDDFSIAIAKIMFKEFKHDNNTMPKSDRFMVSYHTDEFQLYWTPRALCILEGSIKRSVNSNYWVNRACDKIAAVEGKVVIPDLRYRSEIAALKERFNSNCEATRVERSQTIYSTDPSERDLEGFPFEWKIDNTGSFEKLYKATDNLLNIFNKPTPSELV